MSRARSQTALMIRAYKVYLLNMTNPDIAGGARPSEDSLTKITLVGRVRKPPVKLDL